MIVTFDPYILIPVYISLTFQASRSGAVHGTAKISELIILQSSVSTWMKFDLLYGHVGLMNALITLYRITYIQRE